MWTMDSGQHYVQKQHNKQHIILDIDKQWGQIRPTVILAKKVTETSGSKICFLSPTCLTSSPREGEPKPLVCFCLWLVSTFPWKNNILLCLAILSWVQRCCSKGGLFWVTQPWPQPHLPFVIKCMWHDRSTLEFCLMTPLLKGLTLHLSGPPDVHFLKVSSVKFEYTDD